MCRAMCSDICLKYINLLYLKSRSFSISVDTCLDICLGNAGDTSDILNKSRTLKWSGWNTCTLHVQSKVSTF